MRKRGDRWERKRMRQKTREIEGRQSSNEKIEEAIREEKRR